ncbi:MAG: transglutaminase-like domain-containing protein, partial [Desulfobacterales bacterium]
MKTIIGVCLVLFIAWPASAANYLLNGGQESNINYKMTQKIEPTPNIRKLILTYVVPATFDSPTYSQNIETVDFSFVPPPTKREEVTDARGNHVITVTWLPPLKPITSTIALKAKNTVKLKTLTSNASFPVTDIPEPVKAYLAATEQVASNDPAIMEMAKTLTRSAKTEFDAVQKIMAWVVDHMHYVLTPKSYDSMYSFETGKGNCQNYSHLAAALMRAVGIPVRIVNGITMKKPYDVTMGEYIITMKLAEGRHSWIEIYFPDLGWVPSDAQGSQMFISNRFLRVEVGLDNNETEQDGLVSWSRRKGSTDAPEFSESIDAKFETDTVDMKGKEMTYGPRESLFTPAIEAAFTEVVVEPPPPPPPVIPEIELKQLVYSDPFRFGNLEFPENVDFLTTRGPAQEAPDGTMKAKKNFLVETAEYVTTKGQ